MTTENTEIPKINKATVTRKQQETEEYSRLATLMIKSSMRAVEEGVVTPLDPIIEANARRDFNWLWFVLATGIAYSLYLSTQV